MTPRAYWVQRAATLNERMQRLADIERRIVDRGAQQPLTPDEQVIVLALASYRGCLKESLEVVEHELSETEAWPA